MIQVTSWNYVIGYLFIKRNNFKKTDDIFWFNIEKL